MWKVVARYEIQANKTDQGWSVGVQHSLQHVWEREDAVAYRNKADRKYDDEYRKYQGKPEQLKNRAARNKARAELMKEGRVAKGDGQDVDHKTPLSKGGSTGKDNLRVKSKSANRSFKRNKDHGVA